MSSQTARSLLCLSCGFITAPTPHPPERVQACPKCRTHEWSDAADKGKKHIAVLPPLQKRLANFTRAAIEHARAGSPTCTQERIDSRYAICRGCELYIPDADNPEIGHCGHEDCGCGISRVAGYVSKLAWADQQCPLGKWPPIEAPTQ